MRKEQPSSTPSAAATPESSATSRFLRLPAVVEITGVSPATIYRWARQGYFPRPVRLGPRLSAWPADEVRAWQRSLIARRDTWQ
ncbi:MAG: helix-turn-helix transcriptional regulator [Pseudomonadales bacterium]